MKFFILLALLAAFSTTAMAGISQTCSKKAIKAVEQNAVNSYDQDGISVVDCEVAPNNAALICDMRAQKGDGAANDSYTVVLTKSCSKVLRVELTGEE